MKIAIAGYGIEGKANYTYWNALGHSVTIVDERTALDDVPTDAQTLLGTGVFSTLQDFDMVVRTASLPPQNITTNGKVWSATNEFFARCAEKNIQIIGVTGTKGKGTACSLITSILSAAGKTVHLVGNIGVPALDVLSQISEDDIVVYELSSFQLWDLEYSPHVAVVLMIEPDHLDVHTNFEEYIAAKSHITTNQLTTDRVIYFAGNKWSTQIASQSVGQRLAYPSERTAHVRGNYFYYLDTELCTVDQLQLSGEHNVQNTCAAITAIWPWVQDGATIAEGLRSFKGLPHRLKFVREVNDIQYYDDSIATTPGSAIAALRAFSEPKIIILGGSDKGIDYTEIISVVKQTDSKVLAIGQTGEVIYRLCVLSDIPVEREDGLMPVVVQHAASMASPGDVVILSPASASFDQYKNYSDRGEQFAVAVEQL